jgi:hypothetical protein
MRLQGRSEIWIEAWIEGWQEGWKIGWAAGSAKAIFTVFGARGIEVDDSSRMRVESCCDADVLKAWLDRSVRVASASELFT